MQGVIQRIVGANAEGRCKELSDTLTAAFVYVEVELKRHSYRDASGTDGCEAAEALGRIVASHIQNDLPKFEKGLKHIVFCAETEATASESFLLKTLETAESILGKGALDDIEIHAQHIKFVDQKEFRAALDAEPGESANNDPADVARAWRDYLEEREEYATLQR